MPQLPLLPTPGHGDLPDYDVCLPANLRPDADRLIRYLHELPHRRVKYCPWCGHTNLNLQNHLALQRLPRYYCGSCRKSCNSLSDSPFAHMRRMDLWSTFAVYLLAGWSSVQIAPRLGVNHKVYFSWGQAVREVMAEECPELHQWWTTRHYRENLQPPEHIAAQQQAVITWIETMLNAQHATCPRCGGTRTYRIKGIRPKFKCDPCVTCFSILSGTPLVGMIRPELWIDFVKGVMDGQSIPDLKRRSGLGMGGSTRWREQFLLLIDQLGHPELLQWITWMRSRRNNEAVSFVRQGGHLDKATRSVYPQGTRKGRFVSKK
ncbi:transposase [Pseudomonas sp. RT4P38]